MLKVELEIHSIVPAHSHGAYTLILSERGGARKLPILIGGFEAQAIAMEIEKMRPSRPLTHDLMANIMRSYDIDLLEVFIGELREGVFFSTLSCVRQDEVIQIDSRTSDAMAIAIRFKCPIYTTAEILEEAGYEMEDIDSEGPGRVMEEELVPVSRSFGDHLNQYSDEELEAMLEEAKREEDYEKAAMIRDELAKRKK